jgi:hypothetical protein
VIYRLSFFIRENGIKNNADLLNSSLYKETKLGNFKQFFCNYLFLQEFKSQESKSKRDSRSPCKVTCKIRGNIACSDACFVETATCIVSNAHWNIDLSALVTSRVEAHRELEEAIDAPISTYTIPCFV